MNQEMSRKNQKKIWMQMELLALYTGAPRFSRYKTSQALNTG
jgi:hypothetical protein